LGVLPVGRVRPRAHRDPLGRLRGGQRRRQRLVERDRQLAQLLLGRAGRLGVAQGALGLGGRRQPLLVLGREPPVGLVQLRDVLAHPSAQRHGGTPSVSVSAVGCIRSGARVRGPPACRGGGHPAPALYAVRSMLMVRQPSINAQRRTPLSTERIIEAALRIVDGQGLARLTMRRLGDALEVEAMAIYHHLPRGKEQLLDALVTHVASSPAQADGAASAGWREPLRRWAAGYRERLLAHAGVLPLLVTRRNS